MRRDSISIRAYDGDIRAYRTFNYLNVATWWHFYTNLRKSVDPILVAARTGKVASDLVYASFYEFFAKMMDVFGSYVGTGVKLDVWIAKSPLLKDLAIELSLLLTQDLWVEAADGKSAALVIENAEIGSLMQTASDDYRIALATLRNDPHLGKAVRLCLQPSRDGVKFIPQNGKETKAKIAFVEGVASSVKDNDQKIFDNLHYTLNSFMHDLAVASKLTGHNKPKMFDSIFDFALQLRIEDEKRGILSKLFSVNRKSS